MQLELHVLKVPYFNESVFAFAFSYIKMATWQWAGFIDM